MRKILNLSTVTLLVALSLSTVAAYYSIIGLTAIFAGAVIPVIIMGSFLEIGKITTTVWLRKYWNRCGLLLKTYLVTAVIALAVLTSMGIFGFLSKAHMETGITSGDVQSKLALYDEKIKIQKENIEVSRKALQQMDAQVDARLSRGTSEQSAERAVQIRRQQQGERNKILKEIAEAQKQIASLNEERAPVAAENRKVEAEVGPIKYVAALIYGDNPDSNLLERAVRWVIILLVIVFDPLAIALVLAANASREWDKQIEDSVVDDEVDIYASQEDTKNDVEETVESTPVNDKIEDDRFDISKHPYLLKPWVNTVPNQKRVDIQVYKPEQKEEIKLDEPAEEITIESTGEIAKDIPQITDAIDVGEENPKTDIKDIKTHTTKENPIKVLDDGEYVILEGKHMRRKAAEELRPDLFLSTDQVNPVTSNFGTIFPRLANRGDIFVRVDFLPNRVFKFDGKRWIEINKEMTQTYLNNESYLQHLIAKIDSGEYDIETLSDHEKEQIKAYLDASK